MIWNWGKLSSLHFLVAWSILLLYHHSEAGPLWPISPKSLIDLTGFQKESLGLYLNVFFMVNGSAEAHSSTWNEREDFGLGHTYVAPWILNSPWFMEKLRGTFRWPWSMNLNKHKLEPLLRPRAAKHQHYSDIIASTDSFSTALFRLLCYLLERRSQ